MKMPQMRALVALVAFTTALYLGGCGGGGSGGSGDNSKFGELVWGSDSWQQAP